MILTYLLIFFAKILEVTLATVITVLLMKGERFWASVIQLFQAVLWVILATTVLKDATGDPIKVACFTLGFAVGVYLGSILEEKIALGLVTMNIITSLEDGDAIAELLRANQVGVTTIKAEGKEDAKKVLMILLKRRRKKDVVELLESSSYKCVISVSDTRTVYGGYGLVK